MSAAHSLNGISRALLRRCVFSQNSARLNGAQLTGNALKSRGLLQVANGSTSRGFSHTSSNNQERGPQIDLDGTAQKASRGLSPYITGLFTFGVLITGYGLYQIYSVMTMWPSDIRKDLRSGLLAKRKGEYDAAVYFLARAWEKAKELPLEEFGEEPVLKTTGIAIAYAGILEQENKLEAAYNIYEDAFWELRTTGVGIRLPSSTIDNRPDLGVESLKSLSNAEKMRAIALSHKLGELAHELHKPVEEEKWLTWSVESIIRCVLHAPTPPAVAVVKSRGPEELGGKDHSPKTRVLVEQLGLPSWTVRHDIAAPFEALASLYAKRGNITYALPLYLQAISILIPPTPNVSPVDDKCRGAQLMGNMAELMVRNLHRSNVTAESIGQAESWARKGLDVVTAARKVSPIKFDVCEEAYALLLYNVAMIRDLAGDTQEARSLLKESLQQSEKIDMKEGIKYAQEAISNLDSGRDEIKPIVTVESDPL
ncbi:hypothetical protein D9613_007552 [Agrocybe pediades]|uniref:Uncharacterized protein n=1 Tax=Agrocybe pediades TaxID=84607 RepID=A0A8H4QND0_9AGAR|nr:hypothetical protein D9613_007552 [Agrocybe pediades]